MSWIKLDDKLADHAKIYAAGAVLPPAIGDDIYALGAFVKIVTWSNRHTSDGFLTDSTLQHLLNRQDRPWAAIVDALISAGLAHRAADRGGVFIHDFSDWNPTATEIKQKLLADRERKRSAVSTRNPNGHGRRHAHGSKRNKT